jgi:hypothetical protein
LGEDVVIALPSQEAVKEAEAASKKAGKPRKKKRKKEKKGSLGAR